MVKLRLQRFGSKKRPYYRVVAAEATSPRDGRFIEIIGTYQPTDTVKSLFTKLGINAKFVAKKSE